MDNMQARKPQYRTLRWSEEVLQLQDILLGLNLDMPIYIVGGAVRDAFLHLPVKDLDLATPTQSIKLARKITNALDGDMFIMDADRGVVRVLLNMSASTFIIDIANFRGDDLLADLQGRDFTINAMAVDMLGDLELLIDPLNGAVDATQKVIRRCTPQSITEDPIRSLRAVRQSTQLKFRIEPETIADIRQHGKNLSQTSEERVRDEFFNILDLEKPALAIKVIHALGLLQEIIPQLTSLENKLLPEPHIFDAWKQTLETVEMLAGIISTISYRRTDTTAASFAYGMLAMQFDRFREDLNTHLADNWANGRTHKSLMILAALLHRLENATGQVAQITENLRLSNPEKKTLMAMVNHYEQAREINYDSPLETHRFWYPLREQGVDTILLGLADYLATFGNELVQDDWLIQVERAMMLLFAYYKQYDTIVSPDPLITGNELMTELSLEGGPIIGDILTYLREQQVLGQIKTPEEALAAARRFMSEQ